MPVGKIIQRLLSRVDLARCGQIGTRTLSSGAPSESPRCRITSRRRLAPEIHDMIREATVLT